MKTVLSGISVYGGFDHQDADFAFKRSPNVTTTVSATGAVFTAPQIDLETHIAGFTMNASTPAMAGASTYGVRAGNGLGHLYVQYNVIKSSRTSLSFLRTTCTLLRYGSLRFGNRSGTASLILNIPPGPHLLDRPTESLSQITAFPLRRCGLFLFRGQHLH